MNLHKPYRLQLFPEVNGHKSCWNCQHIRVGSFPYRTCLKHPEQHIWSDPETEVIEAKDNKTIADQCVDFEYDK